MSAEPVLAPVYTASKWATIATAQREQFDGKPLTNAAAVALIREWHNVSHSGSGLWYSFAAAAYGWSPPNYDKLDTSPRRGAMKYPTPSGLWHWIDSIASELDSRADGQPPRIAPEKGSFYDPTFYGDVRAHLVDENAKAVVTPTRKAPAKRKPSTKSSVPPVLLILGAWWLLTRKTSRRSRR